MLYRLLVRSQNLSNHPVPELLCPAGSLEKLQVAISYGADAVYLSGQKYGLREASDNFSQTELSQAVPTAHAHGVKVYVTLNGFLQDGDLEELPHFVRVLSSLGVDGVIVSDMGVLSIVQRHSNLKIHLSTQASCLNTEAARWYRRLGVSRIILGREASIEEAARIKSRSGLEVEMFIHGSLCSAYSGNCVISNYTRGRDANRGGCAHSCRLEYQIDHEDGSSTRDFFMSSRDLNGLSSLEHFARAGIDSVKIEGRMKGHYYAGITAKVYADALKHYSHEGSLPPEQIALGKKILEQLPHRQYYSGNLPGKKDSDSIYKNRLRQDSDYGIAGLALESVPESHLLIQVKNAFSLNSQLNLIPFEGEPLPLDVASMNTLAGKPCRGGRPGMLLKHPPIEGARTWNIVQMRIEA